MHSLRDLTRPKNFLIFSLIDRYSPFLLTGVLTLAVAIRLAIINVTDGGSDILGSDIPKSLMLLNGQNPYSIAPWQSPYPPFLLMLDASIVRIARFVVPNLSLLQLSQDLRLAGLFADLVVGIVIYKVLRLRGFPGLFSLIPVAMFVLSPAMGWTPYYFFQSDRLGYPMLALALLGFVTGRLLIGSSLLALSVIFKVHPFLALVLVLVWLFKKYGLVQALPSIGSSLAILFLGLVVPLWIPGYARAVLGFNMSNGYESGTSNFTIMNLFYGILPSQFNIHFSLQALNQIWIGTTAMLFFIALGIVWTRAESMNPIDVVLIGLLVWLLPLRKLFTSYVTWAVIPFLMRTTNLAVTLVGIGLLETANLLGYYCYFPPGNLPMNTVNGFFITSLAYAGFSTFGLLRATARSFMTGTFGDR
jgi:hypothetical protein